MASTSNPFDFLLGGGDVSASAKKKNKNKNKNKPKENAVVNQTAVQNGHAVAPDLAPNLLPVVLEIGEGCATFEQAAREIRTSQDAVRVWKEWIRLHGLPAEKSLKYKDGSGHEFDVKQTLLQSKALELSVEKCLSFGLTSQQEHVLVQLFTTFLPESHNKNQLANLLVRLSNLLASDVPETLGAAQRAVSLAISSLKGSSEAAGTSEGSTVATFLSRYYDLERDISRHQNLLQKISQTNSGVVSREQVKFAEELYKLYQKKADLLHSSNVSAVKRPVANGNHDLTQKSLDELITVIGSRLQSARLDQGYGNGDAHRGTAAAAYSREASILDQQAAEVASSIRTLEAQLKALKAQAADIADKQAQLQGRFLAAQENLNSRNAYSTSSGLGEAEYKEELSLAMALQDVLFPSRNDESTSDQVIEVLAGQVDMPLDFMSNAEEYLRMVSSCLAEVPGKVAFCHQRISQCEKILRLASAGNDNEKTAKQMENTHKLLVETMTLAEELTQSATKVASEVTERFNDLVAFNSKHAAELDRHLCSVTELLSEIKELHAKALASTTEPPPQPARKQPTKQQEVGRQSAAAAIAAQPPVVVAPVATVAKPVPVEPKEIPLSIPVVAEEPKVTSFPEAAAPVAFGSPPANHLPPRQWAKIEKSAAVSQVGDDVLPTPAEAFKTDGPDAFRQVGKKNRKKA